MNQHELHSSLPPEQLAAHIQSRCRGWRPMDIRTSETGCFCRKLEPNQLQVQKNYSEARLRATLELTAEEEGTLVHISVPAFSSWGKSFFAVLGLGYLFCAVFLVLSLLVRFLLGVIFPLVWAAAATWILYDTKNKWQARLPEFERFLTEELLI